MKKIIKKEGINKNKENQEVAIRVDGVSKTFRIPHEKYSSLKSAALNIFKKKTYTEFQAAKDISFEVKKGEFFGIIGRNGSGKSTLLKMLAGIYNPDSGKITINGKLSPFLELGVGFNPELTARENVYLGGSILGLSRKEIDQKFDEIIKFAELEDFVDMKFKNFSSGMQVRLAFALSINAHAEILLMDEVLAVGDENFQSKCIREFTKYRDSGKTVVLVSHNVGVIQKYCDRACLLERGKIKKIGKPDEVGDYYLEENIKKQSVDIKTEDRKQKIKRTGIHIKKIILTDDGGKPKYLFKTHDNMRLKISYTLSDKNLEKINFAVGLRSQEGSLLFGCTTEFDQFLAAKDLESCIELDLKEINLLNGEYYFNVTCFGDSMHEKYEFIHKAASFNVYNTGVYGKYTGVMSVEHVWSKK